MYEKEPVVYIMSNKRNGTLYIGVTSDLQKRVWEHKNNVVKGFTEKYKLHLLVYFELHTAMYDAMTREKQLKAWKRIWKLQLIEKQNPHWQDYYATIF